MRVLRCRGRGIAPISDNLYTVRAETLRIDATCSTSISIAGESSGGLRAVSFMAHLPVERESFGGDYRRRSPFTGYGVTFGLTLSVPVLLLVRRVPTEILNSRRVDQTTSLTFHGNAEVIGERLQLPLTH